MARLRPAVKVITSRYNFFKDERLNQEICGTLSRSNELGVSGVFWGNLETMSFFGLVNLTPSLKWKGE